MALIDLLPPNYKNSGEVIELQGAFEHWTEALNIAKEDLFLQLNVSSATWGLNIWEKALGIEIDVSKPSEYRRTRIMSKLRGAGTTTKEMIQNVSESYANGEVDVIENNPDYIFTIKFVGLKGIPPNLDDLKKAIEDIKPAHLAVEYEFTYNQWSYAKTLTWGAVKENTWGTLKVR